jgi:hypothetical protein
MCSSAAQNPTISGAAQGMTFSSVDVGPICWRESGAGYPQGGRSRDTLNGGKGTTRCAAGTASETSRTEVEGLIEAFGTGSTPSQRWNGSARPSGAAGPCRLDGAVRRLRVGSHPTKPDDPACR